ncbi:MAG: sodium-dependent transporter [Chlamydiales bacterium]
MSEEQKEFFTSRWGFILSVLGIAVGAGNIWRFSRVVAQNGGGSFIIPWVIFLFIWSIPLIFAEIALGKLTRRAPIGALIKTAGPKFAWMGAFIALVTTGILFYYSVVVGWGIRYFLYSLTGTLKATDHQAIWNQYIHSLQPLCFHITSVLIGSFVIYKGIAKGIERSNKILVPTLILIILTIACRAVTLPGAWKGISYFFTPKFADLLNYKIWIEALTQNAWDTGAGWGLLLVYSGYIHKKDSVTINGSFVAFGNNAISLIMGITIFATAFSIENQSGIESMITGQGSTNTGLIFIYLPKLFYALPGGLGIHTTFSAIFFLAFTFAALSSMISMLQLTAQVFKEMGIQRNKSIFLTSLLTILLGIPSAMSMAFFENQDWVWSLGLIVNGLFTSFAVATYGTNRFRKEALNTCPNDFKIGKFYNLFIKIFIPAQAIILILWYFSQSLTHLNTKWWNPFQTYGIGTIVFQWGLALIIFFILNNYIAKKTIHSSKD